MEVKRRKLILPLLGCIGVVGLALFALSRPTLFPQIIGSVALLFFGFGLVVLTRELFRKPVIPRPIRIVVAESIDVSCGENPEEDEVISECWRADDMAQPDYQMVNAVLHNWDEFAWQVYFAAPCLIREDPFALEMERCLNQALGKVPGVKKVMREDTEKWIVDGSPDGVELVKAGK